MKSVLNEFIFSVSACHNEGPPSDSGAPILPGLPGRGYRDPPAMHTVAEIDCSVIRTLDPFDTLSLIKLVILNILHI